VQLYLQRWGLTPQKPLVRAKQRRPAAIAAWLCQGRTNPPQMCRSKIPQGVGRNVETRSLAEAPT
jgi:hypothetical protein